MLWCGSTEVFMKQHDVHTTVEKFEAAMKKNHPAIAPSMLYAWAAVTSGIPFGNGAPNLTVDVPAIEVRPDKITWRLPERISKQGRH